MTDRKDEAELNGAATFKCPSCGAYLTFDPDSQGFTCPYCHASFDEKTLREKAAAMEAEAEQTPPPAAEEAHLRSYHCQSCGAEIVTTDTTAATRCYYCHNPVVLTDRVTDTLRPDGVIPFQLDREAAEKAFDSFIRKKRFVDRRFFSKEQRENLSGVYYPYWFGDIEGAASFDGEGVRTSVQQTPREIITITRHYRLHREGELRFTGMVRKALQANDRKLSDGIHPYDDAAMKDFSMAYLSGFLAEKRDVEELDAARDMAQEAQGYVESEMTEGTSLTALRGTAQFTPGKRRMRYVLLPTWVLTYKGDKPGTTYFYMMNGQTGAVCGKLPVNKGKLLLWSALAGLIVFAALCGGGAWLW